MPTCPEGHESETTDYCDECGTPMSGKPKAAQAPAPPPPPPPVEATCANCGAPRDGRFCEECGHDATKPVPAGRPQAAPVEESEPEPIAAVWTAVVRADRDWYEEVRAKAGPDAGELEFPPFCPERRFVLEGPQLAIGRRSARRGIEPDIDLTGPPLDPGVSALHALLLPRPDGGWQVVDLSSTNGTTLGEAREPLAPNTPVPLSDGDRIKLGAWTTITITATAS